MGLTQSQGSDREQKKKRIIMMILLAILLMSVSMFLVPQKDTDIIVVTFPRWRNDRSGSCRDAGEAAVRARVS